jgi:hypothetical protein
MMPWAWPRWATAGNAVAPLPLEADHGAEAAGNCKIDRGLLDGDGHDRSRLHGST